MKKPIFTKTIRLMLCLMVGVTLIGLVLGQFLINSFYRSRVEQIEKSARQYLELYNEKLGQLNTELLFLSINDANVKAIANIGKRRIYDEKALLDYYINVSAIQTRLENIVTVYGEEYYVWIYEKKSESYIDYGTNDYPERRHFREIIKEQLDSGDVQRSRRGKWFILDQKYICTAFRYGSVYAGAWISVEDYFDDIMKQEFSSDYTVSIYDQEDTLVRSERNRPGSVREEDSGIPFAGGIYGFSIDEHNSANDFSIVVRLNRRWFENGNLIQMAIILASFIILMSVLAFSLYVHKYILRPVLHFYSQIVGHSGMQKLKIDTDVAELDNVAGMINKLTEEIQTLEMEKYKQTIRIQETELHFAQQQIRPHFYINCLNVIYSMAQLNKRQNIQELCLNISEYLRLLFKSNMEEIPIRQELDMIDKYLSIMHSVYGQDFVYSVNVECNLEGVGMPPLLIQTFVENSIKHGEEDEKLSVSVNVSESICRQRPYLLICIQDSGRGFPAGVLEAYNAGGDIPEGGGVGIRNVVQRLKLIFEEDFRFVLSNNEKGANVSVRIPKKMLRSVAESEYIIS